VNKIVMFLSFWRACVLWIFVVDDPVLRYGVVRVLRGVSLGLGEM